jgi:hypothetical protein
MLVFPREIETHVFGCEGVIHYEQFDENGNTVGSISLSVHQFEEIYNRQKSLLKEAEYVRDEE